MATGWQEPHRGRRSNTGRSNAQVICCIRNPFACMTRMMDILSNTSLPGLTKYTFLFCLLCCHILRNICHESNEHIQSNSTCIDTVQLIERSISAIYLTSQETALTPSQTQTNTQSICKARTAAGITPSQRANLYRVCCNTRPRVASRLALCL